MIVGVNGLTDNTKSNCMKTNSELPTPNFQRRTGKALLMTFLWLLTTALPAQTLTTVTTNQAGQVIVSTTLTNMDQLLAALKQEAVNNASAPVSSFATTVLGYFTSFNADLTNVFATGKGYAFAGVDSLQGGSQSLANSLVIDYRVFGGLALDTMTRNGGVSGTIMSQSLGLAYNLRVKDVNVCAFAHGGYDFTILDTDLDAAGKAKSKLYGEFGVRAMKALTTHTFAGVGLSLIVPDSRQCFTAFAGFTF